jgi:ribosomal protein L35
VRINQHRTTPFENFRSLLRFLLILANVLRGKGGRSHNTGHKGRKRVNQLAASAPISEKAIEERMRRLIGA